jgi:hypothetical protein
VACSRPGEAPAKHDLPQVCQCGARLGIPSSFFRIGIAIDAVVILPIAHCAIKRLCLHRTRTGKGADQHKEYDKSAHAGESHLQLRLNLERDT